MCDLTIRRLLKSLVVNYSLVIIDSVVAALFGCMLMLADKQEDRTRCINVGADKTHNAKGFVVAARAFNALPHHAERKGPPLEPRWQDDQVPAYSISLACHWLVERASKLANHRLYLNRWL